MRKIFMLALLVSVMLSTTSCFKDEPLNAECDIEAVTLITAQPGDVFFQLSDTLRNVTSTTSLIQWEVRPNADITAIAPHFTLTEGATISPASGVVQDFSNGPITYTVTSQDGNWSRTYQLEITRRVIPITNDTLRYDFENFELDEKGKYYIWHNTLEDGSLGNDWATGNGGFQLSKGSAGPMEYPTVPAINEGVDGNHALRLVTRDTGTFGVMVNKRIAAGNFFMGEFDVTSALKDAMKATRFGKPFGHMPTKYEGYYKYTPGEKYQDKQGKEVAGMVDNGSVYAVFYRNHDDDGNPVVLYGDDVQTNEYIVAIAKVKNLRATSEWIHWDVDFEYTQEVDEELLQNMGYSLTIVFSSSINGDVFEGAVGSELMIDQVRVVYTHNNE